MKSQQATAFPFGHTRSRIAAEFALITPDTQVWAPAPDSHNVDAAVHISPEMGARFLQQTLRLAAGGSLATPTAGVERFVYVLDGEIALTADDRQQQLELSEFAFLPADSVHEITSERGALLATFDKPFDPPSDDQPLKTIVGSVRDCPGEAYEGDDAKQLQKLLPDDERFDMAVNLFSYQPGAALPQVEIHVMEHGLLMLEGAGVYRLGDFWSPVATGDVIWMASYCPQWFVAMGKSPARYLYYKDVNRDPMAGP